MQAKPLRATPFFAPGDIARIEQRLASAHRFLVFPLTIAAGLRMNDNAFPLNPKPAKSRWRWLLVSVLLAALIGLTVYWYAHRNTPRRHFHAGVEAFARNDLDAVRSVAEALRGVDGCEPHLHVLDGMVLLRGGRLFEAIVEFGHARDHPDTRALAYALSGEALYKARLFRDAQRILTTAIKLDPSQTDARRWLAAVYYDIGAMNHALNQLEVVAEQAPDDPRPHRLRGLIFKDFEEYGKAIVEYRQSLGRDPDQPDKHELLVELAECLVKERRHAEAMATLRQCPRSAHVLVLEAECRYAEGNEAGARKLIGEALKLAPNHLGAIRLQAMIDLESNGTASAVRVLRQAIEHHPKQWRVRYQLVRAYQRLGRQELAQEQIKVMQELRELRDRFTELHEEAIADPANVETRYQLGLLAGQLDKPALAHSWFLVTLAMDPDHAGARQALQAMMRQTQPPPEDSSPRRRLP